MANFIIDASVALKWTIEEEDSNAARDLLLRDSLAAPEFLWIECANVLWTKARRGQIAPDDARAALGSLLAAPVDWVPARELVDVAHAIAVDLDQTVYDSLYMATALARNALLVTADARFYRAAAAHGLYKDRVIQLGAGAAP